MLGLPTFVYHGLSERYPYASDRHHRFILEGAIDVSKALGCVKSAMHFTLNGQGTEARAQTGGINGQPGHHRRHTDRPNATLDKQLAQSVSTPIIRVDTACIVPMSLSTRSYSRAFAYRDATSVWRGAHWSGMAVRD